MTGTSTDGGPSTVRVLVGVAIALLLIALMTVVIVLVLNYFDANVGH